MNPPANPLLYTQSVKDATAFYYRNPTKGRLEPDGTFAEPQPRPYAPSQASPVRRNNGQQSPPQGRSHNRRRDDSPPEYHHQNGGQHSGAGNHSGPQHYTAAQNRPRGPHKGPRYADNRDRNNQDTRDKRDYHHDHDFRRNDRGEYDNRDAHRNYDGGSWGKHDRSPSPLRRPRLRSPQRAPTKKPAPPSATAGSSSTGNSWSSATTSSTATTAPDINTAALAHGHPVFPHADVVVPDDVSDHGDSAAETDAVTRTRLFKAREQARVHKAVKGGRDGTKGGSKVRPRSKTRLGRWFTVVIHTYEEAQNLLRWSNSGERTARALVLYLEGEAARNSTTPRSEGVAYILSQQSASRTAFELATTGKFPESRRQMLRDLALANTPAPDEPLDVIEAPETEEELPDTRVWLPSYVGASPPGSEDYEFLTSTLHAEDAQQHYATLPTSEWPMGMRTEAGVYPKATREKPLMLDVRVACTFLHLCPDGSGEDEFTRLALLMFSAEGMFARYIQSGKMRFGTRAVHDPYPFATEGINMSHVASWFTAHGIACPSDDVDAIESYARSHHNRALSGLRNPANKEFPTWPEGPQCAAAVDDGDIISWDKLVHPPLREGVDSNYPRRPSAPDLPVPEDIEMGTAPRA
ncbi:hypothetical protein C8R46DRAFT_1229295 [Mycena filopes]|nr:hypothetical protein C8R46DRAFT_1229295 [Mycena filopes]